MHHRKGLEQQVDTLVTGQVACEGQRRAASTPLLMTVIAEDGIPAAS
jgi:hypothetical protein